MTAQRGPFREMWSMWCTTKILVSTTYLGKFEDYYYYKKPEVRGVRSVRTLTRTSSEVLINGVGKTAT